MSSTTITNTSLDPNHKLAMPDVNDLIEVIRKNLPSPIALPSKSLRIGGQTARSTKKCCGMSARPSMNTRLKDWSSWPKKSCNVCCTKAHRCSAICLSHPHLIVTSATRILRMSASSHWKVTRALTAAFLRFLASSMTISALRNCSKGVQLNSTTVS